MLTAIFSILSLIVVVYTILCFINIVLSWIPGLKFTRFGKVISKICDPYMNFFSKRGWFRVGNLDFSPILSIGILSLLSTILGHLTSSGRISFGIILSMLISMIWDIASALLGIFFLVVFIRWIVLLSKHGETPYNSIWTQVDLTIGNLCRKISGLIVKKPLKYVTSLLITWISTLIVIFVLTQLVQILQRLCSMIPF